MPDLQEKIQADLNDAMRNKDGVARDALRMLIAAVKNASIEAGKPLDDEAVLGLIQKQVKQRRESIAEFEKAGRKDLVEKEASQATVLERYLPEQASREEIEAAARKIIDETGASSARDIGKVMPPLVKEFAGRADGRAINEVVRSLLS